MSAHKNFQSDNVCEMSGNTLLSSSSGIGLSLSSTTLHHKEEASYPIVSGAEKN